MGFFAPSLARGKRARTRMDGGCGGAAVVGHGRFYSHLPDPTNPAQYQGWVLWPAARRSARSLRDEFQTASAVVA